MNAGLQWDPGSIILFRVYETRRSFNPRMASNNGRPVLHSRGLLNPLDAYPKRNLGSDWLIKTWDQRTADNVLTVPGTVKFNGSTIFHLMTRFALLSVW
jgi:hypothetical protein